MSEDPMPDTISEQELQDIKQALDYAIVYTDRSFAPPQHQTLRRLRRRLPTSLAEYRATLQAKPGPTIEHLPLYVIVAPEQSSSDP